MRSKSFWQFPWGYRHAALIGGGLVLIGFVLEAMTPARSLQMPGWPFNAVLLAGCVIFFALLHALKNPVTRWLSSVPTAITATLIFFALCAVMALLPQGAGPNEWMYRLGLTRITHSRPFVAAFFFLFAALGLTVLKRSWPLNRKNIFFLLNHFGLWLILAVMAFGSGDYRQYAMTLSKGHLTWKGQSEFPRKPQDLDFAFYLRDFQIEEYAPVLAIVKKSKPLKKTLSVDQKEGLLDGWRITIRKVIANAVPTQQGYEASEKSGAAQACLIQAIHPDKGNHQMGWVTCGSFLFPPRSIDLGNGERLIMPRPKIRRYRSIVDFHTKRGEQFRHIFIEVNKPFKYKGWQFFQAGYDTRAGKWSRVSIIDAVYDPWLPAAYAGMIFLALGSVLLIWKGKSLYQK